MNFNPPPVQMIEESTFDEIAVGDQASVAKTVSQQDIDLFAIVSATLTRRTSILPMRRPTCSTALLRMAC